jgi:hypothetical protein
MEPLVRHATAGMQRLVTARVEGLRTGPIAFSGLIYTETSLFSRRDPQEAQASAFGRKGYSNPENAVAPLLVPLATVYRFKNYHISQRERAGRQHIRP